MKRIIISLLLLSSMLGFAQNKYSMKDVSDFKYGLILSAKKMSQSVPIQTSDNQTLIAVGVTDDLITYKYRIDNWASNDKMSEFDILESKYLGGYNILRSQQYLDMFLECLRRTGLHYQVLFFSKNRVYIGGYTLTYDDFIEIRDT